MAAPTSADLAALLGRTVTPEKGSGALAVITAQASAFTRGNGFVDGVPNDEIKHGVILPATARLISNSRGLLVEETFGPQSVSYRSAFTGFSISELAVLRRYRVQSL